MLVPQLRLTATVPRRTSCSAGSKTPPSAWSYTERSYSELHAKAPSFQAFPSSGPLGVWELWELTADSTCHHLFSPMFCGGRSCEGQARPVSSQSRATEASEDGSVAFHALDRFWKRVIMCSWTLRASLEGRLQGTQECRHLVL